MIVQSAPEAHPHFAILQADHARFSGQFAAAIGNEEFTPVYPQELIQYVIAHHDEGWVEIDSAVLRDPATSLPYHLGQTPVTEILQTNTGSPDFNEKYHPLCGILSSMHTYGLYHGRYGLFDKVSINDIAPKYKPAVEAMLLGELQRQERLKVQLRSHPETNKWASDSFLFHNYKLLQFCDTLALYFNLVHETARRETAFLHVPRGLDDDVTITIRPVKPGLYSLSPYPFNRPNLEVWCNGRFLHPQPPAIDLKALFWETAVFQETITLVAGF